MTFFALAGCGPAAVSPPQSGGGSIEVEAPGAAGSQPAAAAPAGAPEGAMVEEDGPLGGNLSPEAAAWVEAIHQALHAPLLDIRRGLWTSPDPRYRDPKREVVVEIQVDGEGKLADAAFLKRSGLQYFDDAMMTLLTRLGTLPVPPKAIRSDDGVARLRWRVARDSRGCGLEQAQLTLAREPLDEALPRLVHGGKIEEAVVRVQREIAGGGAAAEHAAQLARVILQGTLDELDGPTRRMAVVALGRAGDPQVVKGLLDLVRYRTADAPCALALLGKLGARDAMPLLKDLVLKNDGPLSLAAVTALKSLGDLEAALPLLPELKSSDERRRLAALAAMAIAPHGRMADALTAAALDPSADIRSAALKVIGEIGGDAAAGTLLKHARSESPPAHRAAAFAALGKVGARQKAIALAAQEGLRDRSAKVRAAAFATYLKVAPAAALLESRRAFRDTDPAMLLAAIPVLVQLGGADATAMLDRILAKRTEPELKAAVAAARARLRGGPVGPPPLEPAVVDALLRELASARGATQIATAAKLLPAKHGCEPGK